MRNHYPVGSRVLHRQSKPITPSNEFYPFGGDIDAAYQYDSIWTYMIMIHVGEHVGRVSKASRIYTAFEGHFRIWSLRYPMCDCM